MKRIMKEVSQSSEVIEIWTQRDWMGQDNQQALPQEDVEHE